MKPSTRLMPRQMASRGRVPGLRHALGRRLRVRLHRRRLDRELADGCDASQDRVLRASELTDPGTRRELARSLREVVANAENPRRALFGSAVPVLSAAVLPWREGLLGLAERLEQRDPINPCGVARVLSLLTDGTGPLYNPASRCSLEHAIWRIADGSYLCRAHDWQSPALTKPVPDPTAWRCARCGAIAATDDPAVRPA